MTFKSSTKRGCIYGEPSSSTETNLQDGNDGNKFNSNGQHLKSPHIPTHNDDDKGEFIYSHMWISLSVYFRLPWESIIVLYLPSIYIDYINEPKQKHHRCLFGQLSAPQQRDCCKDEEDIDNCSIRSKKLHVQSSEDKSTHRSKHI